MANIKITGYAELAAPISTDLVEVVSDPGGTPISKKVQIRNLFKGGGQIAFPATAVPSADANTLNDYEKGTYTATLICGTSGTITVHADADILTYTKIGRVVYMQGEIRIGSVSSPVGSLQLNLPFTGTQLTETAENVAGSVCYTGINAIGSGGALVISYYGAVSHCKIFELTTTSYLNDTANHIKANTYLTFSLRYIVE